MTARGTLFFRMPGALVVSAMVVLALIGAAIYFTLSDSPGSDQPSAQSRGSGPAANDDARVSRKRLPRIGYPLIGANYNHWAFPGCSSADGDTGILATYHKSRVRQTVRRQLLRMRRHDVTAIRTIIWHRTGVSRRPWGVVPSDGGRLGEPYRTNLMRYVHDVKRFGFARLTVAFSPQWTSNPRKPNYERSKFGVNWAFIKDVRPIIKTYGPRDTRIDLLNEGAPGDYYPKPIYAAVTKYLRRMWTNYVTTFGRSDVSVSATPARKSADQSHRLQNLINIFKSTGLGLPPWFDLHIGYTAADAEYALRNSDGVLSQNGVSQPIVVGETAYNYAPIARVIRRVRKTMAHRIEEVSPWYLRWTKKCNVKPPYSAGVYRILVKRTRR